MKSAAFTSNHAPARLLIDDDLMEARVFAVAKHGRDGVSPAQIRRFHADRERTYSILDPDDRALAFAKIFQTCFVEWQLDQELRRGVALFPWLARELQAIAVRKARFPAEECADLFVNEHKQRHGVLAIRPDRFDGQLIPFLNHEFHHLSDMVDPDFAYDADIAAPGLTASALNLIRRRYALLWDVTIDGRLTLRNLPTVASGDQRRAEFESAFGFLAVDRCDQLFDALWSGTLASHPALLDLASDPRGLKMVHAPVPGGACPLCGFATFEWADNSRLNSAATQRIESNFPDWSPAESCCFRCAEIYTAAFGLELPSTVCL